MVETAAPTLQEADKRPESRLDKVKLWHERVGLALRGLEDWAKREGPDRLIQEYNGKFELFFNGLKGKIPVPPLNKIYSHVQTDVSHTYNRDPKISVNPKKDSAILGAKLWEVVLGYYWRHLRTKEEVELEIIDKDLTGLAWHKAGFAVETDGPEKDLKIIGERLYSCRVEWKDVVWNFGAERPPHDCLWMAQRIVKPLSIVQKKYPKAKNLKGVQSPEVPKETYDQSHYKDDISVAVLWEVWDREAREWFLLAEGLNDDFLRDPQPWPEYMDEFPFLMYWDIYAPGKRRPMSPVLPWEPQLLEEMAIMAATVNHVKRWNRQMLVKQGSISEGDLDKIERGDDGAIVSYTGSGDLDKNTKILDWGAVPTDYYLVMDRLNAIQRDTHGQTEMDRGNVMKTSTRTEGELMMIQAGSKGRQDRKVDRFEAHLENIARHMMKHLQANFDVEETVYITGLEPKDVLEAIKDHLDPVTKAVTFTPKDIEGDYDVEVKAGSTLPLNGETKRAVLKDILATLAQLGPGPLPPTIRLVIAELLREYDIRELQLAFQQEQAMQQMEMALRSKEIGGDEAKAKSQAQKNLAQAQKVQADTEKTNIENAVAIHQATDPHVGMLGEPNIDAQVPGQEEKNAVEV